MSSDRRFTPTKSQTRIGTCSICRITTEVQPSMYLATLFVLWHIYEDHRTEWVAITGSDQPPQEPDPRIPAVRDMLERVN